MREDKERFESLSPIKKALWTIERLQAELDAREQAHIEPIAIIGMACRFPGGAHDPDAFWRLLREGRDAIREAPADRFDLKELYDPDPDKPGKMYMRYGGFLDRIDEFDAPFFRISPREAAQMDPQQRLFLEVSWEALENAGQPSDTLSGSPTGVFAGVLSNDYAHLPGNLADRIDAYYYPGINSSFIAGRLSYFLGLHGQSIALDTACSSSLVAVHLACQSLRLRECDLALAGGVNLILSPEISMFLCKARAMSPTGRCRAFDRSADGMIRGEGCGVVVLKRLRDAVNDCDSILAVIRGSAVNHDGPSGGLTVPNPRAQEMLYRTALKKAGVEPNQLSYVEAHGTGTKLGDPVELQGLASVFCESRRMDLPLWIGSVKTNIGHTDSAAGIAGLIKTVLILQHGEIPPSLHFSEPNPEFPWKEFPIAVANQRIPLSGNGLPYLAGVSSFGLSGINAHVIVEAFHASARAPVASRADGGPNLLPISAKTPEALRDLARSYRSWLFNPNSTAELPLYDICSSAGARRTHFEHRLAIVADTRERLADHLDAFLRNDMGPGLSSGETVSAETQKLAFVFSGQGPQWWGMGRELLKQETVYREKIEEINEIFYRESGWSILEEMTADEAISKINHTEVAQPALFALQVGLAALWKSWGIMPQAVMGHSVGEVAAAHIAGVLALEEAVRVIYHRGRLMQKAAGMGKMAAAGMSLDAAQNVVKQFADSISIAAYNSPVSVVFSGEKRALEKILAYLKKKGVFHRELSVNYAFHSPQMEPYQKDLEAVLEGIKVQAPVIPVFSSVTGQLGTSADFNASYWARNIRDPVLFAAATKELLEKDYNIFLEISPHPVLAENIAQCIESRHKSGLVIPSLRRGRAEAEALLESLGAFYARGFPVDFRRLYPRHRPVASLPNYPWKHSRYWVKVGSRTAGQPHHESPLAKANLFNQTLHPLLGRRFHSVVRRKEIEFESDISLAQPSFLGHHRVCETAVLPAAAYLEMALAAQAALSKSADLVLAGVVFHRILTLSEGERRTIRCLVAPADSKGASFQIFTPDTHEASEGPSWTLHASGTIPDGQKEPAPFQTDLAALQARITEEISVGDLYERVRGRGVDYGPSFRAVERLWRREGEALGQIQLPEALAAEAADYRLHPVLLDACFQVAWAVLLDGGDGDPYVPVSIERLRVCQHAGNSLWSHVLLRPDNAPDGQSLNVDIELFAPGGSTMAVVEGLTLKKVHRADLHGATTDSLADLLYEVEWRAQASPGKQVPPDYLSTPPEIQAAIEPLFANLISQPDFVDYRKALTQLEAMSAAYVLNAVQQMGGELRLGQRFTTARLAEQLGVVHQHHRLLGRCLEILMEEQVLRRSGEEWEVAREPEVREPEERAVALLEKYPSAGAELNLLRRCGASLPQVLQGACDPLELLFPKGDLTAATKLFRDSPSAQLMNTVLTKAVVSALERLPKGRTVRVLEIGAGTASTTSFLLPHLPERQTEYLLTDISPLFTAQAQEKLSDYPFVRCQLLDIERAPGAQGFRSGHYDIIVAANVLHATRDLRQTLKHVREMLASGGILLLLEVTAPQRWIDLTFGLTEGWWRFADHDLRPSYPLLSAAQWQRLLEQSGFKAARTIPATEDGQGNGYRQAVIVAQGAQISFEKAVSEPRIWLIFADAQGIGQALAALLRSSGDLCILVFVGKEYARIADQEYRIDPASPADFQRLLSEAVGGKTHRLRGVAHLWGVDTCNIDDSASAELNAVIEKGCGSALHLVQSLVQARLFETPRLWLVTRGVQPVGAMPAGLAVAQAPLWGLGRVIASEHPEIWGGLVDLDGSSPAADAASRLFDEISSPNGQDQVAYRGEDRYVPRLVRRSSKAAVGDFQATGPLKAKISRYGMLENLALEPMTRRVPGPDEVEIEVRATGLNFRDVLNALGMLEKYAQELGIESATDMPFGYECAGKIVAVGKNVSNLKVGDRVIAGPATGSLGSFVTVRTEFVVLKPEELTFEEAATLPIAFLTAYYALHCLAKVQPGDRVLIHSAAGGVGLAAVQLAQHAGAEVFATASPSKWEFLKSIGVQHVMNSRTLDFADEVMAISAGRGVDIVLNSLNGEFIAKSLEVCGEKSRFVEIGQVGIFDEDRVRTIRPDVSYFYFNLGEVAKDDPELIVSILKDVMHLVGQGALKPLPHKLYPIGDMISAFRDMAQARHIGKLVISLSEKQTALARRDFVREDSSYLITGGLGGLGLRVARWMVEQGARHLVLVGRSGASSAAQETVSELEQAGARILVVKADVADTEEMRRVLEAVQASMPPLRGIVHAAGVLDDGVLLQQNLERFRRVMAPKVTGAWNLHTLTKEIPLDYFVCFSSAIAFLGSPAQGNHAAANAFVDALAHHRRALGLPGLSINWGFWARTGAAASLSSRDQTRWITRGMDAIAPEEGLEALGSLLREDATQAGVMRVDWSRYLQQVSDDRARSLFDGLSGASEEPHARPDLPKRLRETPPHERRALLIEHVRFQIAMALGFASPETIQPRQRLFDLGIDSLMAVELRSRLELSLGSKLRSTVIFDYPTVEALVDYLGKEVLSSQWNDFEKSETPAPLEDLSQDEIADLLAQELSSIENPTHT